MSFRGQTASECWTWINHWASRRRVPTMNLQRRNNSEGTEMRLERSDGDWSFFMSTPVWANSFTNPPRAPSLWLCCFSRGQQRKMDLASSKGASWISFICSVSQEVKVSSSEQKHGKWQNKKIKRGGKEPHPVLVASSAASELKPIKRCCRGWTTSEERMETWVSQKGKLYRKAGPYNSCGSWP